jgi:hypothetical protein
VEPHPSHLRGLLGPLLTLPDLNLVKGAFGRSLRPAIIQRLITPVGSAS